MVANILQGAHAQFTKTCWVNLSFPIQTSKDIVKKHFCRISWLLALKDGAPPSTTTSYLMDGTHLVDNASVCCLSVYKDCFSRTELVNV